MHMSAAGIGKLQRIYGFYVLIILTLLFVSVVSPQAVPAQVWTATGSLNVARAYHTATRLQDGRVLVAGGYDYYGAGWLSSCEIYNPVTGVWTTTGSLNTARYQHTATLLNDGRVLVAAGYASNGALKTAELFDPVQGTWTYTNGELITARQNHTATRLNDGRVVVAGGTGGFVGDPTNKGEFFNPSSGTWTATGNLKVKRRGGHTATLLADGDVMVAGGLTQVGDVLDYLNSAETMNSTGVWSLIDPMKNVRAGHRATRLLNDKVLVTGGSQSGGVNLSSAELYDPVPETFAYTGAMDFPRDRHTATRLPDGKVLVAGGGYSTEGYPWASSELYDPDLGTWSPAASLNQGRFSHTATLLNDGRVLVVGGIYLNALASAELYGSLRSNPSSFLFLLLD